MKFRALDADNDWSFGRGIQSYAKDETAIKLNIYTRLFFFLNDCFFAMDQGIDWWNLIGGKNPQARAGIILQTRTALVRTEGVVRVNSVDAIMDSQTRKFFLSYNVDTLFTRNLRGDSIAISPTP